MIMLFPVRVSLPCVLLCFPLPCASRLSANYLCLAASVSFVPLLSAWLLRPVQEVEPPRLTRRPWVASTAKCSRSRWRSSRCCSRPANTATCSSSASSLVSRLRALALSSTDESWSTSRSWTLERLTLHGLQKVARAVRGAPAMASLPRRRAL